MLSGPTLIVLGQTIILGLSPNATTGGTNGVNIPGISNPLQRNLTRREDYTYTPGIGGHKVHNTPTKWIKAFKICREEGGHLAVINSVGEADRLAELIAAAGPGVGADYPDDLWLGNHDLVNQNGNWETIFGDSLADAGFNEWHTSKSMSGAMCGGVHKDGRLNWLSCTRNIRFICEIQDGQSCTLGSGKPTQESSWWIRSSLRKVLGQK